MNPIKNPNPHSSALVAIMGMTITTLMDALEEIAALAHSGADWNGKIAELADNAIEATKALKGNRSAETAEVVVLDDEPEPMVHGYPASYWEISD